MTAPISTSTLTNLAMAPMQSDLESKKETAKSGNGSFFQALASAWGSALDAQAGKIEDLSASLEGTDNPSAITELTAESLRFGMLTQSAQTSISAVGEGESTLARK